MAQAKTKTTPELWWRWSVACIQPEAVSVARHTASCVWLAPTTGYDVPALRSKRKTDWYIIAPTRLECLRFALDYEVKRAEDAAASAKSYADTSERARRMANALRNMIAAEAERPTTPVEPPPPKITDDMV